MSAAASPTVLVDATVMSQYYQQTFDVVRLFRSTVGGWHPYKKVEIFLQVWLLRCRITVIIINALPSL